VRVPEINLEHMEEVGWLKSYTVAETAIIICWLKSSIIMGPVHAIWPLICLMTPNLTACDYMTVRDAGNESHQRPGM